MIWDGKVTEGFTDRLQQVAGNGPGYLEVRDVTRERRGWAFLENASVVAVLVDGYQPRLARRLTSSGFVSVADMGEVLKVVKDEYDPAIAGECVARGLIDTSIMEVLYREFMLSAASSVDEWQLGASEWVADIPPWEGRSTPVLVPSLVTAMARRKDHWIKLWAGQSVETIPDRVPVRYGPAEYQPATPDEGALLSAVNGKRTVDQVAGECGFTRFQAGHLVAALMAKNVLDLFPVSGPRPAPDSLRVEAGYYAPSQPLPDQAIPDLSEGAHPVTDEVADVASTADVTDQASVPAPVHVPAHEHGQPVAPTISAGPEQPWAIPMAGSTSKTGEPQTNSLPPTLPSPAPGEIPERAKPGSRPVTAPAPPLGEFFANAGPAPTATPVVTEDPATIHPALPPLPTITGGPSDFYVALPAARPLPTTRAALPGTAVHESLSVKAVMNPADADPASAEQTRSEQTQVEPSPTMPPAAPSTPDKTEREQLENDLIRLTTEKMTAVERATQLRHQAARHASDAGTANETVQETIDSIFLLKNLTSEAGVTAVAESEGLQRAHAEDARVTAVKARLEEESENVRQAIIVGQQRSDEANAAYDAFQQDLQTLLAQQEANTETVAVATDSAARCEVNARQADAAAAECDQLLEEVREHLAVQ